MKKFLFLLLIIFTKSISAQINCNKWLYTPSKPSYVDIGNLNVTGNKITVEAVINRTQPFSDGTGNNNEGDIVSKHDNPNDVNYLLRPNHAAITTTNGYFVTPDIEEIELNKTYHVAMVYDGATLKFYRNGCLMSQVAATGDLFQNNWNTRIGYYQSQVWNSNFIGYINEVRIWNVARSENDIRTYMNTSLPNPTTQTGLLAYYTFDNLQNKQGNSSWNGTLGGSASINQTNTGCNSIVNSCDASCNNWLKTPSAPSSVKIGQLNITGNHVTVEATINRTAPYSGGQIWAGDVVSKHRDPKDVNYLLRPNTAEITTTTGYYKTPDIADIELNKTYHIAMVYDGDSLKFYRNGCLMSDIKATGNLVQNSWETTIGYFSPELDTNENFIGYINEVRIWNVSRTQAEIQTYMNSSLPNPATQPGLLAYYTFDNLLNKQGNASWNGTLNGSATINETNPNCNPIEIPCLLQPVNCNNWLKTPSHPSYVQIGQLNVTGDQITVEAAINRSTPTSDNPVYNGDIVSKHNTPADVNYLLRSFRAEITTTNGFFTTPWAPDIEPNKTYHIAFTYDGKKLKFYRNGCLLGETDATGDLIQNSWNTRIGDYEPEYNNENFIGYINEVRIWNVARTQEQLQANMNTSLSNPTTQTGLLAYYTFDNLLNKQGNAAFNGTLGGSASINETNPACAEIPTVCNPITKDSIIINEYTPVVNFDVCKNELTVADASKYNPGDTVLLIQMKGAEIDSTNSVNFGTIQYYNNSGNYEFNIIKQKNGNKIILLNLLERPYDFETGKVQLVRVPHFDNLNITSTLTCLPWDGSKGGVLAFNVKNSVILSADIDVSGKGFRHGLPMNSTVVTMNEQQYYYDKVSNKGGEKGESIYSITDDKNYGRGAPANGGGGGNAHNSGGGGGANGGIGGNGGDQWETGKTISENVGGKGGHALINTAALNKLYFGGSGGMGQANDQREYPAGNGGGIIIINATSLSSNHFSVKANGDAATEAPNSAECKDGMAGGGAGGSIFLNVNTVTDKVSIEAKGGKGADHIATNVLHGPGGGGGGGVVAINQVATPLEYAINLSGGINGVNVNHSNDPYGATAGNAGIILNNFKAVIDKVPFKQNIDSIRISQFNHHCTQFDFKALAYTQTSPIVSWNWNLGDNKTNNSQNVINNYAFGNYIVKLTGTDINGCKDSFHIPVDVKDISVTKRSDTALCGSSPVKMFAAGGVTYAWTPTSGLNNSNIADPVATPLTTTKYFITVSSVNGCSAKDSVNITINSIPVITKSNDTTICYNSPAQLLVKGGSYFSWTPAATLNDANIANPIASPASTTTYQVKVSNNEGCSDIASIKVNVKPTPFITKSNDSTICKNTSVKLFVTGGNSYKWFPNTSLDNSTGATAIASPSETTLYHIDITDINSCIYHDSIKVFVRPAAIFSVSPDNSVCATKSQQLIATGGDNYSWTPALFLDNPNIPNPVATPDTSITYSVKIKENTCNESAILFTKLIVLPSPDLHIIKSNDINCTLPSAHLTAYGAENYIWTPASGLNKSTIPDPVATPLISTVYTVTGKGVNGCINSDTISVKVDLSENRFLGLPNSFTPNGDGLNDCFGISYWGPVDELSFSIYNRWGQRVFFTTNSANCWDGTFKGEPQNAGVFVYIIKAKTICGNIEKKGTVTLLR